MFAKPRPKKSILPPPSKKRKTSAIEEITFDTDARHEFLTGFHKRKLQRVKHAQEEAAKRERKERIETRRQAREDRKREVEEHVNMVNKLLRESGNAGHDEEESGEEEEDNDVEWDGFPDQPDLELVDHEEEYIDEDRYTTVTVESVNVSRDGLTKPSLREDEEDEDKAKKYAATEETKPERPKKAKKKKFRYETKLERQLSGRKQRAKSRPRQ